MTVVAPCVFGRSVLVTVNGNPAGVLVIIFHSSNNAGLILYCLSYNELNGLFYIYAGVPAYLMRRVFENSGKFLPCIFPKCFFSLSVPRKVLNGLKIVVGGTVITRVTDPPLAMTVYLPEKRGRGATKGWLVVCCLLFLLFVVGYDFVDAFGGFLAAKKKNSAV